MLYKVHVYPRVAWDSRIITFFILKLNLIGIFKCFFVSTWSFYRGLLLSSAIIQHTEWQQRGPIVQEQKGEVDNSLPGGASDLFNIRCEVIGDSGSSYCHKISLTRMEGLQPKHTDYQKKKKDKKKNRRHWAMAKINSINLAKPYYNPLLIY